MFQLRTYTLRSAETLDQYATVHWARHIPTLQGFGVTTHGIWTESSETANRLIALISFADGADPAAITAEVMASAEFAADMTGFDSKNIVAVDSVFLDATDCSPIR
jgi:hypothetical protein